MHSRCKTQTSVKPKGGEILIWTAAELMIASDTINIIPDQVLNLLAAETGHNCIGYSLEFLFNVCLWDDGILNPKVLHIQCCTEIKNAIVKPYMIFVMQNSIP